VQLQLIVFDLAGTLIDDGGAVLNAYRMALSGEGVSFSEADIQAARGGNKRAVLQALSEREFGAGVHADAAGARAYEQFDAALMAEYGGGSLAPMAGAEEALRALRYAGLKLATNTGFHRSLATLALGRLGWRDGIFDAHVAGDEVPEGRPAPYMIQLAMQRSGVFDTARVLVCGDTPLDLRAGTNAGVAGVVGVLTGTHGVESLGAVRHTHLLPSVASLPRLVEAEFK
jgi:phosphonatase-like hydrolase